MSILPSPVVIIKNIIESFFKYRDLTIAPINLIAEDSIPTYNIDSITDGMIQYGYIRIDAKRNVPRGSRDWVVIFILYNEGDYFKHGPKLRKLLDSVYTSTLAQDRLDELIVIAESEFFAKKNLIDVITNLQKKHPTGPDFEGKLPFYGVYPYNIFVAVIPECVIVPKHRIMSIEEVDMLLNMNNLSKTDLAEISTTDPVIVWLGGKEGQVVEITRDSYTAGEAIYYRRIEKKK